MFWRSSKKSGARGDWAPGAVGARVHRRARCANLFSNIGRVVDLSPTGAGVLTEASRFRPGMQDTIRLETPTGQISLDALVVWVRSADSRLYRVGLRFLPGGNGSRAQLRSLCKRLHAEELDRFDS